MKALKITVRDFDPKKDIPNPVFKIKISGRSIEVSLSQIRSAFRKYLSKIDVIDLAGKDEMEIVYDFLTSVNMVVRIKDHIRLALCFKTDIYRKTNNEPFGLLS